MDPALPSPAAPLEPPPGENPFVLTVACPDRKGIVHAVSGALLGAGADIAESQQYGSPDSGDFFLRVQFTTPEARSAVEAALAPVRAEFGMRAQLWDAGRRMRTLVMCSKDGHTLNDLLFQQRAGSLPIEVPVVVSNHLDLQPLAAFYGVPFVHVPISTDPASRGTKAAAEARLRELIREHDIDLVVLARYMQILSDELCRDLEGMAINIHHSFLPSFKGARPYHQAHERGVKIIGATAHYVTADLDEGPIIAQSVQPVTHAQTAEDFVERGRDVEGSTLVQAVRWHAEHRVLVDGRRTVVFA